MKKITLKNEQETIQFAQEFAKTLKQGDIVKLIGTLGSGKSVIARTIIQTLGSAEMHIPSPTFTLVQVYDDTSTPIAHMDLYRLEDGEEIYDLDIDHYLENGICLIEWPEIAESFLPQHQVITLEFDPSEPGSTERTITIRHSD